MKSEVVSFSGGLTSGFMVKRLMQKYGGVKYNRDCLTIFCNTGKERNETLDFVRNVGVQFGIEIIWLQYKSVPAFCIPNSIYPTEKTRQNHKKKIANRERSHWFEIVTYETAARTTDENTPFDKVIRFFGVLPNVMARFCSKELKARTIMRYMWSIGVSAYSDNIGIRKDEEHRKIQILAAHDARIAPLFPLVDDGVILKDVEDFWKSQSFTLKLTRGEGNCDLCFLKSKQKLVDLVRARPRSIDWWLNWESNMKRDIGEGGGAYFNGKRDYALIQYLSKNYTPELFSQNDKEDVPCSCAEKMFDNSDQDQD